MNEFAPAQTIDEVIAQLDEIIDRCKTENSALGYFPALYRQVTIEVKKGIASGRFEDGERMERLDVIFANRYLKALYDYQQHKTVTQSWQVAFDGSERFWPIVLQHLMAGMNAHINLDLGIAACQTCPGPSLMELKNDFNEINVILGRMVNKVQEELSQIWPALKFFDKLLGRKDENLARFSMSVARDSAWAFALKLAAEEQDGFERCIKEQDSIMADFGKGVLYPGFFSLFTKFIRIFERYTVRKRIEILE